MKRSTLWAWVTFIIGASYFFIPLIATMEFSLRMRRGEYSFDAYRVVFSDDRFQATFGYSVGSMPMTCSACPSSVAAEA